MQPDNNSLQSLLDAKKSESGLFDAIAENGGEITPELDAQLQKIDVNLPAKIDGYFYFHEAIKSRVDFLETQIKMLSDLARGLGECSKRVNEYMQVQMKAHNMTELVGNNVKFKFVKNAKRTVILDDSMVPEKFKIVKTVVSVDKTMVKKALEQGEEVSGALLEGGEHLRSYLNTK